MVRVTDDGEGNEQHAAAMMDDDDDEWWGKWGPWGQGPRPESRPANSVSTWV